MNIPNPIVSSTPLPLDESERLAALKRYDILDTEAEQRFDDLTKLASYICQTPIALVSLIDDDRQWFKSKVGLEADETSRELAFCAHAIAQPDQLMVVPNAQEDQRFVDNPLVTDAPNIRFYAGAPLVTAEGYALGTLCVIDTKPRELSQEQLDALAAIRRQVLAQIELSRNLTQLTQANLELTQLNQTKNDFLHMAAHDLKNPLSGIMGFAEMLLDSDDISPEETRETVEQIQHASRHMFELVTNLLDVNAIETGQHQLKLAPISLVPLFKQLQQSYTKRAQAKQIEFIVQSPFAGQVLAAESALHQVMDNLVSNAIKYSPANTQVTLRSVEIDTHVQLYIQDQGPGFTDTDKQRLFQKFTRLSAHPTAGEHSSGLGLFIVKSLIDAMQAEIRYESQVGQGTTFVVSLQKG